MANLLNVIKLDVRPAPTYTNSILSTQNTLVPLKENLNCQSERIVYAIKCSNCKAMYVGETSRKLRERFTEHRSNINTKKSGPVAKPLMKSA